MVRRRARANKVSTVLLSSDGELLANGVEAAVVNVNLFDDQYFASPKRKDCKMDNGEVDVGGAAAAIAAALMQEEQKPQLCSGAKSLIANKARSEHAGISDRTIGVPLGTHSQSKTFEYFFKTNTAAKTAKLIGTEEKKTSSNHIATFPMPSSPESPSEYINENENQFPQGGFNKQTEFIFDLSEDTYDTDNTELSDEVALNAVNAIDFATRRSPQRDSHSSGSSTTDNIFLQEPVLTLNIDKSPNQASSIKINKTLELEPVFSSPPSLAAAALNGRFNQIVSLNGSPSKRDSFGFESKTIANGYMLLPDNDNSSCDSGVVFATSLDNNNSPLLPQATPQPVTRRRKPATPHRIVCPSPIKSVPRVVALSGATGLSPTARKCAGSKEALSPRKSQRHITAIGSKTRRRLNHQPQKEQQAPYKSTMTAKTDAAIQNGFKQNARIENEDIGLIHLAADDDDEHEPQFLSLIDVNAAACCISSNGLNTNIAPTLDLAKHKTAQQNATNNNYAYPSTKCQQKTKPSNVIKAPPPKTSKHQSASVQPLTAPSNGNRELTEFFPVRRSVRKTKTAVKEEMMRNIEKAILEERTEGLRVANFEGKGRGIVADRCFQRGEFVVEYVGDLISINQASQREQRYALDENAGCYMYYFKHKNQQYCIDATVDTGKPGRLVNHSRNGNLITKVVVVKQRPHLILIAKDDIAEGEELTYDYGDRSKEALLHHPWLAF